MSGRSMAGRRPGNHRVACLSFEVHELLRQYGEEQLHASGQAESIFGIHARFYLGFLHRCEEPLAGPQQLSTMAEIEAIWENIRVAWEWAVRQHRYELVDHAMDGLFRWFWQRRSRQHEGLALLQLASQEWEPLPAHELLPVWGRTLARILQQQGPWLDKPDAAQARAEEAFRIARQHKDKREIAFCLWALAFATYCNKRHEQSEDELQAVIQLYERCIRKTRNQNNHFWLAQSLEHLGHCYRGMHQFELAEPLLKESLELRRELGDRFGIADTCWLQYCLQV